MIGQLRESQPVSAPGPAPAPLGASRRKNLELPRTYMDVVLAYLKCDTAGYEEGCLACVMFAVEKAPISAEARAFLSTIPQATINEIMATVRRLEPQTLPAQAQ